MDRKTLGYILLGGAVAVWAFSYYQEKQLLASGEITADQTLTLSDRLFSPAGVAAGFGAYFLSKAYR